MLKSQQPIITIPANHKLLQKKFAFGTTTKASNLVDFKIMQFNFPNNKLQECILFLKQYLVSTYATGGPLKVQHKCHPYISIHTESNLKRFL